MIEMKNAYYRIGESTYSRSTSFRTGLSLRATEERLHLVNIVMSNVYICIPENVILSSSTEPMYSKLPSSPLIVVNEGRSTSSQVYTFLLFMINLHM